MLQRTFYFAAAREGQMINRSPGFSIVNVDKADAAKGFRARFVYSAAKNSVFMQYSNQTALPTGTSSSPDEDGKRTSIFSSNLQVAIPTNAVVRFLTTLEGGNEPVDFASRQASGKFEAVDPASYTFRLSGKSTVAATDNVPTEFAFDIDAGHAIMMHRFFRNSLADSMGFPAAEVDGGNRGGNGSSNNNRGGNNRGNYNRRGNGNTSKQQ